MTEVRVARAEERADVFGAIILAFGDDPETRRPDRFFRLLDPERVLSSSVWQLLREARASGASRDAVLPELRQVLRRELGRVGPGRLRRMLLR